MELQERDNFGSLMKCWKLLGTKSVEKTFTKRENFKTLISEKDVDTTSWTRNIHPVKGDEHQMDRTFLYELQSTIQIALETYIRAASIKTSNLYGRQLEF